MSRIYGKTAQVIVAAALLFTIAFASLAFAFADYQTSSYLIITRDGSSQARSLKNFDTNKNDTLANNDAFVADLTSKDVRFLHKNDDVLIVEEDFCLTANTNDDFEEPMDEDELLLQKLRFLEFIQERTSRAAGSAAPQAYEWNMKGIGANELARATQNTKKIKVAVLDSGVDIVDGINLAGTVNLVPEEQAISPVFLDLSGHGTAIASIIAGDGSGNVLGVNPNAALYSVKVLDENNTAPLSRIVEGIYWCIDNDINIINMSFGTATYSHALQHAVRAAYDAGILMIGAAGNNAGSVEYPAAYREVMAVAATNTRAEISEFSNTGDALEIAAPGEKIKVAGFFGGRVVTRGTSIAVPHVVGAASLLWEKDTSKSSEFIRQLISRSAKNIENTDDCGLLDIPRALAVYNDFEKAFDDSAHSISIRGIPKNPEPAETFSHIDDDSDYVEGRWEGSDHEKTITKDNTSGFTATEISILKKGCIYQDSQAQSGLYDMGIFPEWHGFFRLNGAHVNYIAAYDLVKRIARAGGDASSITAKYGLTTTSFNRIKSCFPSASQFGWSGSVKAYSTILSSFSYSSKTAAVQKRYRQLFLYGMAAHILADTFAHSSYAKNSAGTIVRITHKTGTLLGADDITVVKNRYKCAKQGVNMTVFSAEFADDIPGWIDYHVAVYMGETINNTHTFYSANMLKHATDAYRSTAPTSGYDWDSSAADFSFINRNVTP